MVRGHMLRTFGWAAIGALMLALLAAVGRVAYGGPLDPPAAPAPTQHGLIFQPSSCAGFPITLSTAGPYKLAQNITMPAACTANGINISATGVVLDLGGFTLAGAGVGTNGITVTCACTSPRVSNGVVSGWTATGVDFTTATLGVIDWVQANGNKDGIMLGSSNAARDCAAGSNAVSGITAVNTTVIRDCAVGSASAVPIGILISGNLNAVTGNTALGGAAGIRVAGRWNMIARNRVSALYGIDLNDPVNSIGNEVRGNDVYRGGTGFNCVGSFNVFEGNRAIANAPNYSIVAGNDVAPITTAAAMTSPVGNISD